MIWMNMGPRGRMNGRRGLHGGFINGLIALLIGGCAVTLIAAGLIFAAVMIVIPVFGLLVNIASGIFSALFTMKSFIIGIIIGLIWYYSGRKNREYASRDEEEDKDDFTAPKAESWNS